MNCQKYRMRLNELHGDDFPSFEQLQELKPLIADAAQRIYDAWDPDEDGGICDEIASAIIGIITERWDVDADIGGFEGDDHAYVIIYRDDEAEYGIDISPYVYERGGGYNWKKIPDVRISPDDVIVWEY